MTFQWMKPALDIEPIALHRVSCALRDVTAACQGSADALGVFVDGLDRARIGSPGLPDTKTCAAPTGLADLSADEERYLLARVAVNLIRDLRLSPCDESEPNRVQFEVVPCVSGILAISGEEITSKDRLDRRAEQLCADLGSVRAESPRIGLAHEADSGDHKTKEGYFFEMHDSILAAVRVEGASVVLEMLSLAMSTADWKDRFVTATIVVQDADQPGEVARRLERWGLPTRLSGDRVLGPSGEVLDPFWTAAAPTIAISALELEKAGADPDGAVTIRGPAITVMPRFDLPRPNTKPYWR